MRIATLVIALVGAIWFAGAAAAQEAPGDWLGSLRAGGAELRLAVHLRQTPKGLTGTLDSLDQGTKDIPIVDAKLEGGVLSFDVPRVRGRYEGHWNATQGAWEGNWTQGQPIPLTLTRGTAAPAPRVAGLDGDWDATM